MTMWRGLPANVFFLCWAVYTLHWAPYIVREHFPAISLAREGTMDASSFLGWSEDVFRGPRGGAYINNNPGASLVAAVPLWLAQPALRRVERWNAAQSMPRVREQLETDFFRRAVLERREWYFLATAFLTVAAVMAPISACSAAMTALALARAGVERAATLAVVMLSAFGTPLFFRTGYLNHNLLVAHAGWIGFLLLFDPERRALGPRRAAAAGALAGFAVLADFSGLVVLASLGAYLLIRAGDRSRPGAFRPVLAYLVGAAPWLLALLVYQQFAFGSWTLPSQHFMPATAPTVQGYRGFTWPSPQLFWANLTDPRFGMFAFCPLLALGFLAPLTSRMSGVRYRVPAREMTGLLVFTFAFMMFCAANQYSWLQPSTGFRYLIVVVPGLLVLSAQVLQALPRLAARTLIVLTLAQGWIVAATHDRLAVAISRTLDRGPRLSWLRRTYEMGLIDTAVLPSIVLLAATGGLVYWFWRRELACAS